jgi:hypothetical protein
MILSNIEIQRALDEKRLVISPELSPRHPTTNVSDDCPYQTSSVDLRRAKRGQVSFFAFWLFGNIFFGRPRGRIVDSRFSLRAIDSIQPGSPKVVRDGRSGEPLQVPFHLGLRLRVPSNSEVSLSAKRIIALARVPILEANAKAIPTASAQLVRLVLHASHFSPHIDTPRENVRRIGLEALETLLINMTKSTCVIVSMISHRMRATDPFHKPAHFAVD